MFKSSNAYYINKCIVMYSSTFFIVVTKSGNQDEITNDSKIACTSYQSSGKIMSVRYGRCSYQISDTCTCRIFSKIKNIFDFFTLFFEMLEMWMLIVFFFILPDVCVVWCASRASSVEYTEMLQMLKNNSDFLLRFLMVYDSKSSAPLFI